MSYAGDGDSDGGVDDDCVVPLESAPESALAEAGAWLRRVLRRTEEISLVSVSAAMPSPSSSAAMASE